MNRRARTVSFLALGIGIAYGIFILRTNIHDLFERIDRPESDARSDDLP